MMSRYKDQAIDLLDEYGDVVDIYYTQFLEVAFFLKVPASYSLALAFLKKKLPQLSNDQLGFLVNEITSAYHETE
jgi:S-methylmethionine-dependent homocysteine/selenocysteine methylase|tara:strand:+ start:3301 stop:3525 length:225 start_codon:yes stop_codon:yes gene_type:complete